MSFKLKLFSDKQKKTPEIESLLKIKARILPMQTKTGIKAGCQFTRALIPEI